MVRRTPDQQLIAEVENTLRSFVYYSSEHYFTAHSLWIMGTHLRRHDGSFLPETYARTVHVSKTPAAGKTHAMTIASKLCHNGEVVTAPTTHGLITTINNDAGTPHIDEIDRHFGPQGTKHADQWPIINNGYKVGAYVLRQRGDLSQRMNTHGPMGLGGKSYDAVMRGDNFDTLRSRSIIFACERKPVGHEVTKYRARTHDAGFQRLAARLTRWGQANGRTIVGIDAEATFTAMGIDNRDEEVWTTLFQLAAFIGGEWPARVQLAARAFIFDEWSDDSPIQSPAEELLTWVSVAFDNDPDADFLSTKSLVTFLMDDSHGDKWWRREWRSPRAASMGLSDILGTFGIEKDKPSIGGVQAWGYWRDDVESSNLANLSNLANDDAPLVDAGEWDWDGMDD